MSIAKFTVNDEGKKVLTAPISKHAVDREIIRRVQELNFSVRGEDGQARGLPAAYAEFFQRAKDNPSGEEHALLTASARGILEMINHPAARP